MQIAAIKLFKILLKKAGFTLLSEKEMSKYRDLELRYSILKIEAARAKAEAYFLLQQLQQHCAIPRFNQEINDKSTLC